MLNSGEFVRESQFYLHGLTDRASVRICYAKRKTTAKAVKDMAVAECARFNRTAVFFRTAYDVCPLMTPVAAEYDCLAPGDEIQYVDGVRQIINPNSTTGAIK